MYSQEKNLNMNNSKKIKVSTITPCFRMKKYLKGFLDELPNQTYFQNLEVVLDHNEPDSEELEWVKDFQKIYPGKIKHLITNPVISIGDSMNKCIKESTGDFLTIWNVDDLRTNNSIELQVDAMIKKNADIVYGDYLVVRKFGSKEGKIVSHKDIPDSELTRSMVFGPFLMFKKSLCDKAGYFDSQLKSGADFDLSIRLAIHGKAVTADGLLGYYLNEGLGASTSPNSKQPLDRTVIELRYGIYDKIDYDYIQKTKDFDILNIVQFGKKVEIDKFVPDYANFLHNRKKIWFYRGLLRYVIKKILFVKFIKRKLKQVISMFR